MTSEDLPATGFWTRLLRGGVVLAPFERFLLKILEQQLPADMVKLLRGQWRGLNLIQRSYDWQELRFYRLVAGRVDRTDLAKLSVRDGEVKLLSVTLRPPGANHIVNVNFWAVDAWFFSLNSDSVEGFPGTPRHCHRIGRALVSFKSFAPRRLTSACSWRPLQV